MYMYILNDKDTTNFPPCPYMVKTLQILLKNRWTVGVKCVNKSPNHMSDTLVVSKGIYCVRMVMLSSVSRHHFSDNFVKLDVNSSDVLRHCFSRRLQEMTFFQSTGNKIY